MPAMKTAELTFTGGMHFDVATGSGRTFAFDDPPEGGLGPLEMILAAIAGCSAMDVISICVKKRQPIERYAVSARAEQRDEYPQVFTRIDLVHELTGRGIKTRAVARSIELSATKYCPVNAMISAGATEVHHRYRILRPDMEPEEGEVLVTGPYQRPEIVPG
jgi:putative redox protein